MAYVIGPNNRLPGQVILHGLRSEFCDNHPDRKAIRAIQGETDSFGAEVHELCNLCSVRMLSDQVHRECDWCQRYLPLHPWRDFEEGSSARVHYVCLTCLSETKRREHEALQDELDEQESSYADEGYENYDYVDED